MKLIEQYLPLIVLLTLIGGVYAGSHNACCCAHCGCKAPCQKICRLVCEEKKVEVLCWGCKCEDFCVPGHSKRGCCHCECVCDDCKSGNPDVPCPEPKRFFWYDWLPGGAKMYTRTKLMRKSEFVTVPSYKWVVEDLCAECTAKVEQPVPVDTAEVPPPPIVPVSVTTR